MLLVVINGYWYLFYLWLLMFFSGYSIGGYSSYSISGYWWLFYQWLLVAIILMAIDGYWWLFY
jgi:hypothetical protein